MGSINPIDFSFHLKKNNLLPPLKIQLFERGTSDVFDLTGYTGTFYMAPKSDKSTPKISGGTVTITDQVNGKAEYRWVSDNTDTSGQFYFEFRFTKSGETLTVPVVSPGLVYIEVPIG
jgi:hypothetical protein